MIQHIIVTLILCMSAGLTKAQQTLQYYLPDIPYRTNVTTPEDFFGFQVGEWHISHDRLASYMYTLAHQSDRVKVEQYAWSHEHRPLLLLTITSPGNHARTNDILASRNSICFSEKSVDRTASTYPIVIYQGYSVHGDEASATNAAALVAYYLAAGESEEISSMLEDVVILLDPCLNPDGYHRFSTWVNSHKSISANYDPNDREFDQGWPGGRTNHYWFDLNRDWLPAVHPESNGRLEIFHKWKPVIQTDHHEMGSNSTFFFMPGIPSRVNPVTPIPNQELTSMIANYHARALDSIGVLYYSKESYDDFYVGKGSTYPDLNGSIGILFEQAGVEGHARETDNGLLTFPFAIRNQVVTSLSTQEAAIRMRNELVDYQCEFFRSARQEARKDPVKGYVFGLPEDEARLYAFIAILLKHDIQVYYLAKGKKTDTFEGDGRHHFIVPTDQPQYRMIRSIFEQPTQFTDSMFYDVSAWTLPLAFNIPCSPNTSSNIHQLLGEPVANLPQPAGGVRGGEAAYAYIIPWQQYYAPAFVYALMDRDMDVRVSQRAFSLEVNGELRRFAQGSVIVPVAQTHDTKWLHTTISELSERYHVIVYASNTGYTPEGPDLGSRLIVPLVKPGIALLVGEGVNGYEAGELWHLFDKTYRIPVTKLDVDGLHGVNLSRYSVLLAPDGSYHLDKRTTGKLKAWIEQGGVLIASRQGMSWAAGARLLRTRVRPSPATDKDRAAVYANASAERGSHNIGGAIVEVQMDLTHPLAFGYDHERLPVFRKGTTFYEPSTNVYANPLRYTDMPLLAGYVQDAQLECMRGSAAVIVGALGSGRVIGFADDHAFRGFWLGTHKLIANAVFFGKMISGAASEASPAPSTGK